MLEKLRNLSLADILIGGGLILIALGLGMGIKENRQEEYDVELVRGESVDNSEEILITVDIEGEIIKPGVYQLEAGSRVGGLLTAAGGLSLGADRKWVEENLNRAMVLKDGEKIFIPSVNAKAEPGEKKEDKISINSASSQELEELPGVGKVMAEKIVDYRKNKGRFSRVEDILEVPGIGEKLLEKIRNKIKL